MSKYLFPKFGRRDFLSHSLVGSAALHGLNLSGNLWASDVSGPAPNGKKFCLYIHMGSICGVASSLLQPLDVKKWPKGYFSNAANEDYPRNPLFNEHTKKGSLVFHDYTKFLAEIAPQMLLINGTAQSLDHNEAGSLQHSGNRMYGYSASWPAATAAFLRTEAYKKPQVITNLPKGPTTRDNVHINVNSIENYIKANTDDGNVPKFDGIDSIWQAQIERFSRKEFGTVRAPIHLASDAGYFLNTLTKGVPTLDAAVATRKSIEEAINIEKAKATLSVLSDKDATLQTLNAFENLRKQLQLAALMAHTGLASGMTISSGGEDTHGGGADIGSARVAACNWAYIQLFWKWIKANGLDNEVMVIVSHDFSRSPYNTNKTEGNVVLGNETRKIESWGRDHDLSMGMIFLNGKLPGQSRFGHIGNALSRLGSTKFNEEPRPDLTKECLVSTDAVGSLMMRAWPDLFPSERWVRKHWPDFKIREALLG